MKNLFLFIAIALFVGCTKESTKLDLTGKTYSGYSFTSTFSHLKIYEGYKFISDTKAIELLLEENSKIISQTEVGYILNYPDIKIEGDNTADSYLYGSFTDENTLQLKGIIMTKW